MTSDTYSLNKIKMKKAMDNTNISDKRIEKNKYKNEIKYLLAWIYLSMEEYFRN